VVTVVEGTRHEGLNFLFLWGRVEFRKIRIPDQPISVLVRSCFVVVGDDRSIECSSMQSVVWRILAVFERNYWPISTISSPNVSSRGYLGNTRLKSGNYPIPGKLLRRWRQRF